MSAMTVVALCHHSVQAAVGTRRGRRVLIRTLCRAELPPGCVINGLVADEPALRDTLADFWQAHRLPRRGVTLLLGGGAFDTRVLNLPHMPPAKITGVVRHELDLSSRAVDPIDDYMVLSHDPHSHTDRVLATRMERHFLDGCVQLARALGWRLRAIDLTMSGLIRLVRAEEAFRALTFLVLVFDGDELDAFLFEQGAFKYATRSRLLFQRGTPESAAEILQKLSGQLQTYQAERSPHTLTQVYFGGESARDMAICAPGVEALGLKAAPFPNSPLIRLPGGRPLADCLYTAGAWLD